MTRPSSHTTALAADADCYAERGWSCIPILSRNRAKKPLVKWKIFSERLPTEAERRKFFANPKANGIAVIAGNVSGKLAIRDFDRVDAYEEWKTKHTALALALPTVRTKRGYHLWCRSDLQRTVELDDGEYRGAGVSLAPHSEHYTGIRYEWVNPLPKGELPVVEHTELMGTECYREDREDRSHGSVISDISVTSTPEQVIAQTVPDRPGARNACILNLARGLKYNAGLASAGEAVLQAFVRDWHVRALPFVTTKSFHVSWMEFQHAFTHARHPLGFSFVDAAAAAVDPHDLPEAAEQYEDDETCQKLVALCYALSQLAAADGLFFLSSHDAGARLALTPMQAWRLLRMLCDDGILECVEKGNARRAARFRWRAQ